MRNPPIFKICVFGESGVGKSTLLSQSFEEFYNEKYEKPTEITIGVSFYRGMLDIDGTEVKLQIWKFTGSNKEKFRPTDKRQSNHVVHGDVFCLYLVPVPLYTATRGCVLHHHRWKGSP